MFNLLGFIRGWIFVAIFLLLNIILLLVYPKHYRNKIFIIPDFKNKIGLVLSIVYALLMNSTIIYSVFLPLSENAIMLITGFVIYCISVIIFVFTLNEYAHSGNDRPAMEGVYKYSRHPQQILLSIMWIGVGISLNSYIVIISFIIQLVLIYPSLIAQEEFCLKKYGTIYEEYIKRSCRYFGIPKNK